MTTHGQSMTTKMRIRTVSFLLCCCCWTTVLIFYDSRLVVDGLVGQHTSQSLIRHSTQSHGCTQFHSRGYYNKSQKRQSLYILHLNPDDNVHDSNDNVNLQPSGSGNADLQRRQHPKQSIKFCSPRRTFFRHVGTLSSAIAVSSSLVTSIVLPSKPAIASGLLRFPCIEPLHNQYHFMRAGTSILEEQDIWTTNPLFLTNREGGALSVEGQKQVKIAIEQLQQYNIQPSVIRHSLAANAMDTASMIRDELKVGQNRINPEFVFMDPRAIGAWEGMSYQQTLPAIIALDNNEASVDGRNSRPPSNDDGTPNETLFDQTTRLRQLMSGLETQYSGDTILLVFPDGTGPALLSAMIAGIPYNQVHLLDYSPGELRSDVTYQSTRNLFLQKQKENIQSYLITVKQGEEELKRLRSMDFDTIVSKKDQMIQEEQRIIEQDYQQKVQIRRQKEEDATKAKLIQRQNEQQSNPAVGSATIAGGAIGAMIMAGASFITMYSSTDQAAVKKKKGNFDDVLDENDNIDIVKSKLATTRPSNTADVDSMKNKYSYKKEHEDMVLLQPADLMEPTTPKLETEEDRIEAARIAMKQYMERDDGGADWLRVMGQIIEEDSDDDDVFMDHEELDVTASELFSTTSSKLKENTTIDDSMTLNSSTTYLNHTEDDEENLSSKDYSATKTGNDDSQ